jgi:hypothetical protein
MGGSTEVSSAGVASFPFKLCNFTYKTNSAKKNMFDSVSPDEIDFLRLLLKCDANLNQEKKHLKTKLARRDFTEYVEVGWTRRV